MDPGTPGAVRSTRCPRALPPERSSWTVGNPELTCSSRSGASVAYLRAQTINPAALSIAVPVDLATGVVYPSINVGGSAGFWFSWTYDNGIVYCHMQTPLSYLIPLVQYLSAFSTSTNLLLVPNPVPLAVSPAYSLRHGPGSGGLPALFMHDEQFIYEISPTTLSIVNSIHLGGTVIEMELSSGGTEWLIEYVIAPFLPYLATMAPATSLVPTLLGRCPLRVTGSSDRSPRPRSERDTWRRTGARSRPSAPTRSSRP